MNYLAAVLNHIYIIILLILSSYGLHRLYILITYFIFKRKTPHPKDAGLSNPPFVTIQLPIYNELNVIERLLDCTSKIIYPCDRFEIQVIDDSTDETREFVARLVDEYQRTGLNIYHLNRGTREGFKAGALEYGLKTAKGEFTAIFDADFMPQPDVLQRTIPFFSDPNVGLVQLRWEHLNRNFSLLTYVQSVILDGHFILEHTARNRSGCFFNFNGTAGIWRRQAITDSGGWHTDTLTEDLDLSYRTQLRGWKFVFLNDSATPGELPIDVNAFKTQQYRWTKGAIQTTKKVLLDIWKNKIPIKTKLEATFHLTSNISYVLLFILAFLTLPVMITRGKMYSESLFLFDVFIFSATTLSISVFYTFAQKEINGNWLKCILYLPWLFAIGIGLSVNNGKAILDALFETGVNHWERTPKHNVINTTLEKQQKKYKGRISKCTYIELAFAVYFLIIFVFAAYKSMFIQLPFILLFFVGFSYMSINSLLPELFTSRNKVLEGQQIA
jgi:cellulose synthase/poly-beta-1,6-N-acetylglucosamine synthase-like glycosyltransferase